MPAAGLTYFHSHKEDKVKFISECEILEIQLLVASKFLNTTQFSFFFLLTILVTKFDIRNFTILAMYGRFVIGYLQNVIFPSHAVLPWKDCL